MHELDRAGWPETRTGNKLSTEIRPGARERVCVTGGAGFIGSHLVDELLRNGARVVVLDDLSNANRTWLEAAEGRDGLAVVRGSCSDAAAVSAALDGVSTVYHLAANADIRGGVNDRQMDLRDTVAGTIALLDGMKEAGVERMVMTSTGAVYGEGLPLPFSVGAGPLRPVSLYGAGKVAAEAFAHAYCSMFGLRTWIFRLGNVVGARMSRGAIRDFLLKLDANPAALEILGDGKQRKNYFLVDDCVRALLTLPSRCPLPEHEPSVTLNVGSDTSSSVRTIADAAVRALNLDDVAVTVRGGRRGWVGDQPLVRLDVSDAFACGWRPERTSDEAVYEAARMMANDLGLVGA